MEMGDINSFQNVPEHVVRGYDMLYTANRETLVRSSSLITLHA
jgi:hypothetical protein